MKKLVPEGIFESILNETPEPKDIKRIEDLFYKSKGSDPKLLQLAQNMANSIDDIDKAMRRAEAAQKILGPDDNPIADIFLARVEQLRSGGKEIGSGKPPKSDIKFEKPAERIPTENRTPTKEELTDTYPNGKSREYKGIMFLPTYASVALWEWEISGQISDGAWENSTPFNHWEFWHDLKIELGIPEVKFHSGRILKDGYNLAGLIQYVGDRMVKYGRFGKAVGADILNMGSEVRSTIEELPKEGPVNLQEWKEQYVKGKEWRTKDYYWQGLEQKHIDAYYNTKYDERDMRKDLAYIKQAMKNAKRFSLDR